MTATLALDTVEQAEAVLSGRQRYVRVPEVLIYNTPTAPKNTADGLRRVPDPSWVAAAKPTCRKCGQSITSDQYRFGSKATGWEHMDGECGSGVPRVTVTAPCESSVHALRPDRRCCDPNCAPEGNSGRVSVGFVRVEGPLLEVVLNGGLVTVPHVHLVHYPSMKMQPTIRHFFGDPRNWDIVNISDQLPFLAPDGPDSLIGCWVAKVDDIARLLTEGTR